MEQSEVPPKAAADSRVGVASVCDAGSRRGWQWSATRAAPSSGTAHSLATPMLSAAADAGRGIVYGAVGPRVALWRCGGAWAVQGLRALGWFADAGWQDLRAVHDSRGPCSEKGPFLARSSRGVSSDGDLRGISDAWRAYLAKASPFSDAWRANLAANWRFSRPRPLSGCMERKTCHGLPPGNAFREHFAIGKRPGTHRGEILPRQGTRERTARVYCHCQPGQERIRAQSCHRRTLRNASCEHFAIVERPGTHIRNVLPTERHLRAGGPIALP